MNEAQLVKTIKAHIAKGDHAKDKAEQHYISAGQHLKTLKAAHGGSWEEWAALLRTKCDLSTRRASELMQIADGRTSQEKIREADAERKKLAREKNKKDSSGHPEEKSAAEEPVPDAPVDDPADTAPPTKQKLSRKQRRENAAAAARRLASRLADQLDRDTAHALHKFLEDDIGDSVFVLTETLERELATKSLKPHGMRTRDQLDGNGAAQALDRE